MITVSMPQSEYEEALKSAREAGEARARGETQIDIGEVILAIIRGNSGQIAVSKYASATLKTAIDELGKFVRKANGK